MSQKTALGMKQLRHICRPAKINERSIDFIDQQNPFFVCLDLAGRWLNKCVFDQIYSFLQIFVVIAVILF